MSCSHLGKAWDRGHTEKPNDKAQMGLSDLLLSQHQIFSVGRGVSFIPAGPSKVLVGHKASSCLMASWTRISPATATQPPSLT